jgi:hypothetical protein
MKNWFKFITSVFSLVAILSMADVCSSELLSVNPSSLSHQSNQSFNSPSLDTESSPIFYSKLQPDLGSDFGSTFKSKSRIKTTSNSFGVENQGVSNKFKIKPSKITSIDDSENSFVEPSQQSPQEHVLLQVRSVACIFNCLKQIDPVFIFKILLSPPVALGGLEEGDNPYSLTRPWFIQHSQSSSRIAGWKDGNSLYTSIITYHI